ncbi:bifunctional oligoribonuclease/PAP phosphatase NrnA [Oscillospiraceae bacterium HV4-5-C5C]|nr:bifunctional oligoribonuclease/PAP phosphatase NrnA [Oscillospiraceae bacterium HV4-5-C5C]
MIQGNKAYLPSFAAITDQLLSCRNQEQTVYIYPHINADGDALGAGLGLAQLLKQCSVQAVVLTSEPLPSKLSFLPGREFIRVYDPDETGASREVTARQTIALAIDCAAGDRLGQRQALFEACPRQIIIDHHISKLPPSPTTLVNTKAAAVCEIVAFLADYLESRLGMNLLDLEIATCLMTGLMTDTGRFSFSSTTARTFEAAATLMRYPIDTNELSGRLFDIITPAKLRYTGEAAQRAEFYYDGRLIIADLPHSLMQQIGGEDTDLEGLASMLRDVDGVEVAVLLREMTDGEIRGNVRSGEHFDSSAFAQAFGGGGHLRASGFTLRGQQLSEARQTVIQKAGEVLSQLGNQGA